MKKHVTLLTVLVACICMRGLAQAVYVPNGDMENWISGGSYEQPTSWSTPNPLTSGFGGIEVYKDGTDKYQGSYSARLETKYVPLLGANVPGAMGTGVLNIATQTYDGGFSLSYPNVTVFSGYYKYTPVSTDSAFFFASLTHWDAGNNKRDTVGVALWIAGASPAWAPFTIHFFTLMPGIAPDTCLAIVSNAYDVANAQLGTILWVDQMDLSNDLGVHETPSVSLQLVPNPADQSMQITLPKELNAKTIFICSADGKARTEIPVANADTQTINTSQLPQGVYLLFVRNSNGEMNAAGKFSVRH